MSKNTQYTVRYDEDGNIILSLREPLVARLGACPACPSEAPACPAGRERRRESDRRGPREKSDEESFVAREMRSIPQELQHVPSEVRHQRFPRSILFISKIRNGTPHVRIAKDSLHFVGTFTSVFLVLFLTLNFASYKQVFHASLLPDTNLHRQKALEAVTSLRRASTSFIPSESRGAQHDVYRNHLLAVPALPRAGGEINILAFLPDVAPPDNRIILPSLGKNLPIVEAPDDALLRGDFGMFDDDVQNALKFGAVHYPGTAEPGQIGNVFITAHSSNYPWVKSDYNAAFALLPKLKVGDEYSVFYKGDLHKYRVTETFEVSPRDVSVLAQPKDRYMSTLMTCVPVGTTLKRFIVRGEEVDLVSGEPLQVVHGYEAQIEG